MDFPRLLEMSLIYQSLVKPQMLISREREKELSRSDLLCNKKTIHKKREREKSIVYQYFQCVLSVYEWDGQRVQR